MNEITSQFTGKHKLNGNWAKDLKSLTGRAIYERFMVYARPELKKTKKRANYLTVEVGDKTGRVTLQIWDIPEYEKEKVLEHFEVERVYNIEAKVGEFNDSVQLSMNWSDWQGKKPWLCESTDFFSDDFCEIALGWTIVPTAEMIRFLEEVIQCIQHHGYKKILESFWSDSAWCEKFVRWPAAKWYHHAYYGGLLEHVYEMLQAANGFIAHYPNLNLDLLRTAIILHDTGKFSEYRLGYKIESVPSGFLVGHMVDAVLRIDQMVRAEQIKISVEDLTNLFHLILSHHGEIELGFGSAVSPQIAEAAVLYQLDQFSSKVNTEYLKRKRE